MRELKYRAKVWPGVLALLLLAAAAGRTETGNGSSAPPPVKVDPSLAVQGGFWHRVWRTVTFRRAPRLPDNRSAETPSVEKPSADSAFAPAVQPAREVPGGTEPPQAKQEPSASKEEPPAGAVVQTPPVSTNGAEAVPAPKGFWSRLWGRGRPPAKPVSAEEGSAMSKDKGPPAPEPESPRLRPGLEVKVTVMSLGRKEVNEEAKRVSPSGTITLPLLGTFKVEGMTIEDLRKKLAAQYADYLREPLVDVDFVMGEKSGPVSPWGFVTVLGRVKQPGRINIPPTRDLTLSMAVQLAGGLDTSAKLTGIKITREQDGKVGSFEVNLESVGAKGKMDSDVKLLAGDVVYVPERIF